MFFVLQTANVTADAKNCFYPNRAEIRSAEDLKAAVRFDHVCGEFKNNYRSIINFLKSNVIVMDCDNDHSDDPADWITFEKLEELFDSIDYAAAPSRNHMTTAIRLNMLKIIGLTCAIAPWEAKIKFSMFPKIINPVNGA